jgi:hypothetical protein
MVAQLLLNTNKMLQYILVLQNLDLNTTSATHYGSLMTDEANPWVPDRCHRSWGYARLCQIGTGIGHAGCDAPVQRARSRTSLRWRPVACGGNGNPSMGVVMGRGGRLNRPCCRTRLRPTTHFAPKTFHPITSNIWTHTWSIKYR